MPAEQHAPVLPHLEIRNVRKAFGGITAVKDVSIGVERDTIVSIIGPNGAGKTTLFNVVTGFYAPNQGDVLLDGRNVSGLRPHRVAKAGIARTFQNIRLFPWMTVRDNIVVARQLRCSGGFLGACFGTTRTRREERATLEMVSEIIAFFNLTKRANDQAKNLAYGEQRRLEIARALATEPQVLLLDEPTAGMNPTESSECMDLIFKIKEHRAITVMLIEHNMNVVMEISDKICVLDHGAKIAEGSADDIQRNDDVIKAYLGEDYLAHA